MTFGEELIQSVKEALAMAEGKVEPAARSTNSRLSVACKSQPPPDRQGVQRV